MLDVSTYHWSPGLQGGILLLHSISNRDTFTSYRAFDTTLSRHRDPRIYLRIKCLSGYFLVFPSPSYFEASHNLSNAALTTNRTFFFLPICWGVRF
ncbi:276c98e3-fd12-48cc-b2a4-eaf92886b1be [Sclerotinia trifoliorum]|uniref:276c98e3-fd12-48cc-b2a4-eaf92886b1be n=1 Tax=Sclerotinia trifoliorum TaxID=28548 RepID=A0A8H2VU34_9HELO|nr:276c98e3-fd12-48cc-b2a4-eaf92886b1be [Sclerotinia trifoliorum]